MFLPQYYYELIDLGFVRTYARPAHFNTSRVSRVKKKGSALMKPFNHVMSPILDWLSICCFTIEEIPF